MKHSRESMKQFLIDCRAEERRSRTFSSMEENFWDLAEMSPFEQTRIITTNDKVLADPYLMRVYLTPERELLEGMLHGLGVPLAYARLMQHMPRPYLHYFFRGDDDRAFHNHPWKRSLSLILVGGYIEHAWDFRLERSFSRLFQPGAVNYLKRGTYHRVELLPNEKCWTLFVSSGRVQESDGYDWEFYDPESGRYTPWGEWTNEDSRRREFHQAKVGTPVDLGADPDRGRPVWDWSSVGRS